MILRSGNPLHKVGRTLLSPPVRDARLVEPDTFALRVRTRVKERSDASGSEPGSTWCSFYAARWGCNKVRACCCMDGALYGCYSEGLTPPIAIAQLVRQDTRDVWQFARQYPSPGLYDEQLCRALWEAGLPPEALPVSILGRPRDPGWQHREQIRLGWQESPVAP